MTAVQTDHDQVILSDVRPGENSVPVDGQQLFRNCPVTYQVAVAMLGIQIQTGHGAVPTETAIKVDGIGGGFITPTLFVEVMNVDVVTQGTVVATALGCGDDALKGTAVDFQVMTFAVKTVFHLDGQGAAQGIQSEQGIGAADQVNTVYCRFRQQVPVHRVTQGFIDTNAILVNRHALRQAKERGGSIAAVLYIRL